MSQPIIRQSGKLKEIVGIGQPVIKVALLKRCYNCKKLLFEKYYSCSSCKCVYFCRKNASLGLGHMQQNHPDAETKPISYILDEPDSMRVQ